MVRIQLEVFFQNKCTDILFTVKYQTMKKMMHLRIVAFLFALIPAFSYTQQYNWTEDLSTDDSAAIYALVLYPESLRLSIFESCKYPEAIVRISGLQKKTSNAFVDLIGNYSRQEQEDLWDLTRYPDLINKLVGNGALSKSDLSRLADQYPSEIQGKILNYGSDYYSALSQMNQLYNNSIKDFNALLKGYPSSAVNAFNELITMPEVLNILNDHMQMTVLVGDIYKKDPAGLLRTADSLNLIAAEQNAANVDAWKKTISEDAQAQADLKASAAEYASENGYTEEEYTTAPSQYYVEHYVCYSYPYWYGYPYWYPYYYWYPYPYWYDWGFYIDPFGNIIIINTPSYYFTYWYFYYPHHYYYHPYLANVYITHYYGPNRGMDGNTNVVTEWVEGNREYLPENFTKDPINRADAIRDIGKFENDIKAYNMLNPTQPISKDDFIVKNKKEYPTLTAPSVKQIQKEKEAPMFYEEPKAPPVKQPPVKVNEEKKSIDQPRQEEPKYDFKKVDKAQEYHKSVWGTEPSPQRQKPQTRPTTNKTKKTDR